MFRRHAFLIAWFGALALLLATAAGAEIPSPSNSTAPAFIRVVGSTAGVPDTVAGRFVVTVRGTSTNPFPGAFVSVDVSGCPDIRLATDQLNPNYTVIGYCVNHTIGAWTNNDGVVAFTLVGSSWSAGTHAGLGCARLYANGVLLSTPIVSAFDLDGMGGVTTADLSLWLDDFGTHVYRGRGDYDGNGSVSTGDLSLWLAEFGTHRSSVTLASCP